MAGDTVEVPKEISSTQLKWKRIPPLSSTGEGDREHAPLWKMKETLFTPHRGLCGCSISKAVSFNQVNKLEALERIIEFFPTLPPYWGVSRGATTMDPQTLDSGNDQS